MAQIFNTSSQEAISTINKTFEHKCSGDCPLMTLVTTDPSNTSTTLENHVNKPNIVNFIYVTMFENTDLMNEEQNDRHRTESKCLHDHQSNSSYQI